MTESRLSDSDERTPTWSRRRWLGGAAVAGAALATGAVGGAVASAQSSAIVRRERLVLEVACLGDTFRQADFADAPAPNDLRGSPFAVEGWIYPEGTIPGDGFVATDTDAIGHWFCSGFNIQHGERPEPHINASASFVFGRISESQLFPPDSLVTHGLGGTFEEGVDSLLPLVGGSGRYFGVLGQAGRRNLGKNNTVLYGVGVPAPNFLYTFDLLHLV